MSKCVKASTRKVIMSGKYRKLHCLTVMQPLKPGKGNT